MAKLHSGKCRRQTLKRSPPSAICLFLFYSFFFPFKAWCATELPNDFTGGDLSDYMQLPLEPQNASYYFVHICSRTPEDLLSETKQLSHQNKMLPFNVSPNHRHVLIFACYMYHLAISAEWDVEGKQEERGGGGNEYFNSFEAKMALFLLELLPTNWLKWDNDSFSCCRITSTSSWEYKHPLGSRGL